MPRRLTLISALVLILWSCGERESPPDRDSTKESSPVKRVLESDIAGQVCQLAVAMTLFDSGNVERYVISDAAALHPLITVDPRQPMLETPQGDWEFKCRFEEGRVFVTGKHPLRGWRTGPNKWNTDESWGKMYYEIEGSRLTVKHVYADGSESSKSRELTENVI